MSEQPSMPREKIRFLHPATLIGTWFGAGLSPKAPGTVGSIAALPFAYVMQIYWGNTVLLWASLVAFVVGWMATHVYLHYTDAKDPKEIVIDEVAGQWFLLAFMYPTWTSYLVGLALFRFFDIIKPWPVSWADQKLRGGFSVMMDDMLAACYPLVILCAAVLVGKLIGHPFNLQILLSELGAPHVSRFY